MPPITHRVMLANSLVQQTPSINLDPGVTLLENPPQPISASLSPVPLYGFIETNGAHRDQRNLPESLTAKPKPTAHRMSEAETLTHIVEVIGDDTVSLIERSPCNHGLEEAALFSRGKRSELIDLNLLTEQDTVLP